MPPFSKGVRGIIAHFKNSGVLEAISNRLMASSLNPSRQGREDVLLHSAQGVRLSLNKRNGDIYREMAKEITGSDSDESRKVCKTIVQIFHYGQS